MLWKNIRKIRIAFLIVICMIPLWGLSALENQSKAEPSLETFSFSLTASDWNLGSAALKITAWHSDKEGDFYLFLPGSVDTSELIWSFDNSYTVKVDGKSVKTKEVFSLTEGEYDLYVKGTQEADYTLHVMCGSAIAALFLETESGSFAQINADEEYRESGKYKLFDAQGDVNCQGTVDKIKCRGNASFTNTEKKSYSIKLSVKENVLGMGEDKDWLLIANAFDETLMRNAIVFDMAEQLNVSYTPQYQYCDVYLNGEYAGNYMLTEKVEIDENRISVVDLEQRTKELNENMDYSTCEMFQESYGRLLSIKGVRIPIEPKDISGGVFIGNRDGL